MVLWRGNGRLGSSGIGDVAAVTGGDRWCVTDHMFQGVVVAAGSSAAGVGAASGGMLGVCCGGTSGNGTKVDQDQPMDDSPSGMVIMHLEC